MQNQGQTYSIMAFHAVFLLKAAPMARSLHKSLICALLTTKTP
jgi:hypothetical protein